VTDALPLEVEALRAMLVGLQRERDGARRLLALAVYAAGGAVRIPQRAWSRALEIARDDDVLTGEVVVRVREVPDGDR
jgi:hypothetical protein